MQPAVILVAGLFGPLPGGGGQPVAPPPREAPPRPAAWVVHRISTRGVVTAADDTSVTVRGFDRRYALTGRRNVRLVSVGGGPFLLYTTIKEDRHQLAVTLANGDMAVFRREDMPAVRFTASPGLLDGTRAFSAAHSYRPADVRVGDEVNLVFVPEPAGNEEVFWGMQIERRPGGRVPPAPADRPGDRDPWHERANAYQDWEERGIPLPDKYDPDKARERMRQYQEAARRFEAEQAEQAARERLFQMVRDMKPKPPAP
ncbi:MAG: hypothetical protein K2X87_11195 [Gemmataceae bacterium]|nr:hypothetical protein [Gemmataceae bacterium]